MSQETQSRKPYVSIIIPVYNVDQYLKKCLESVLAQDYQDFECILVDDGSTDASGKICDDFAVSDSRIIVIHKKNGGVASAMKTGLQKAAGKFIGRVDPDDWVERDFFENLVNMQKEHSADIVAGNHFRDVGLESYPIFNNIPAGLYDSRSILPKLIYSGDFFEFGLSPSLCTKLIRKEILEATMNIDENISYEDDGAVVYPSVLEADKILVTDICGYHYVQRQGSITKSVKPDDLWRLRLVFKHLENVFRKKDVLNTLEYQINQWKKFIFLERHIEIFDEGTHNQSILFPYGGIPVNSRIVIYGGSFLGQTIDRYIQSLNENTAREVLWIDKAYENFQKQGLPVNAPENILELNNDYDYILLASVTENIICSMKEYLLQIKVPEDKILWLSEQFVHEYVMV